jgi:hypothetical protein
MQDDVLPAGEPVAGSPARFPNACFARRLHS